MLPVPRLLRAPAGAALLAALLLGAACATSPSKSPSPAAPSASASAPAGASARALIGDAACETDGQCATVGLGAKACGGPAEYVAWSSLRTDGARLRAAAEREAQEQREALRASGRVSDCAVAVDPGAYCDRLAVGGVARLGVCRLHGARQGPQLPQVR